MTTQALHPDHLQPGDMVGSWRIVQVLGRGGSARVFKVERDGLFYAMKTALLPLSGAREDLSEEQYVEEVSAYRRLAREAAALFTYSSHPNLLRVHAVDFWPNLTRGYPFLVTDYVEGDTWHQWRWRRPSHAAGLVDTFSMVVRTLGVLHARGVYHRDLKAENILIRRKDNRPFLIDFGTVRLPGALTQTMGLPEGVLHLLPPELMAYTRSEAWKRGVAFQGGVAADLYALGVLLYQALTDLHPFSPELPDEELVAAIAHVPPTPPHLLNPLVPRSLSAIAMKLLEKRPEDRYPHTEALLHALETASEQERHSSAWRVPLTPPAEEATQGTRDDGEERTPPPEETPEAEETPHPESPPPRADDPQEEESPPKRNPWRRGQLLTVLTGLLLCAFALILWRATLAHTPAAASDASAHAPRGMPTVSPPPHDSMTPTHSRSLTGLLTVWLCAATSLGCPAAQVRPAPEACSKEAEHNTFEVLKLTLGMELQAIIDINQPGDTQDDGTYREGPIVGRVVQHDWSPPELPGGTLLYGWLWAEPGIKNDAGRDVVMGRYTEAQLPDGRKLPVCIVLGGPDGQWPKRKGSKPGAAVLAREVPVYAVRRWP